MAEATKIEWTDATVNFWWGCTKVGPGCDHCYAESLDHRLGGRHWGPRAARKPIENASNTMVKLNRRSARRIAEGLPPIKVFVQSMADIFDNVVPVHWRVEAFETMQSCTHLRIQLLTKRVGNVETMIPAAWRHSGFPAHVGLMITVVNQEEADRDVPRLLALKAKLDIPWVGLSIEPMLGPVDLTPWLKPSIHKGQTPGKSDAPTIIRCALDWVICGGESGPKARPMHPDWARSLRDQCADAGVPFLFKQCGQWAPRPACLEAWSAGDFGMQFSVHQFDSAEGDGRNFMWKVGKVRAGRLLDGVAHDQFPKDLMR
jgi:protein gp37